MTGRGYLGWLALFVPLAAGCGGQGAKYAGTWKRDLYGEGEVHIEGAGHEPAIIFFGMRTATDVIYEFLNEDLSLKRAVTVADFDRDWREHWPRDFQGR